jgi:mannose-6-phosphate isomerase-like protein (cupin superfamily)
MTPMIPRERAATGRARRKLPSDISYLDIEVPAAPLDMAEPSADPERLKSCAAAIAARLSQAKSPAILVDQDVARYDAAPEVVALASVSSVSGEATSTIGRERRRALTDESTSERVARVTAVERSGPEPSGAAANRDHDRLLVVTHGRLETEIAGRSAAVAAEAVIIIPAGVPHLIRNLSADPVRYLDADLVAATGYAKLDPGGR